MPECTAAHSKDGSALPLGCTTREARHTTPCNRTLCATEPSSHRRFFDFIFVYPYPLFTFQYSYTSTTLQLKQGAVRKRSKWGSVMRIGLIGASLCLCLVGISHAQSAKASIRKDLNVPAEDLSPALQTVATTYEFQVLYPTSIVKDLKTSGAVGSLTSDEALRKVLTGTGLTYKFLDSNTITVYSASSAPSGASATAGQSTSDQTSTGTGGGKKSSQDFRVAQVDQGKGSQSSAVANQAATSQSNSNGPSTGLEEIVVTAQKREERLQNVPISISVLSGDSLDRSNQGVSEALNAVPGVATQQNYLGGGTVVVIRGVAPALPIISGSSPVAYYLDSVPFGLVKSAIAPDSNAYDLQRVEVLRGPQGTLYGASALNGVVRVLTNDADLSSFDLKARVSDSGTQYGGNNYRGDIAVNVPIIQDKLAIRAVVGYENDSGWIDQPNKKNVNDTEVRTYRLKVNAQPVDNLSIGLSAWSSHSDSGAPSVGYAFDKNASVLNQPDATDYDTYDAKIAYQFTHFSISSSTSYLDYSNYGNLGLDFPPYSAPGTIFFAGEESHVLAEELNVTSVQEGEWRWSVGGMFRRATENRATTFSGLYSFVPHTLSEDISKSYAVYGELSRLFLQDQLELTVGLRHFHDDVSQEEQLGAGTPFLPAASTAEANTPRVVLTWHATDHQMVYASYSQGFRSGFPQDASVPTAAGIAPVQPDRLTNYEIGSKGSLMDGRVAYDSSIYYIHWKGIQQSLTVQSPILANLTVPAIVNSQAANGVGVDFGLSIQPVRDLTLRAAVSWNNLELDGDVLSNNEILFHKGDRPNSSPETTAVVSAEYLFPIGGNGYQGRLLSSANYTSPQDYRGFGFNNAVAVQSGDAIVLARASFSIDSPSHWTATLYGENLNNDRGSPVKVFIGVPNWNAQIRPRTVGVQAEYKFR
jgi:iron complex outermembrane recepter protein